ncbi:sensor histidine kinase [Rothia sp. P13129]|uniref:sensor histidine kinase n=1 Tax=Rothia sp. P13129 TaxID=3402664 RepID=UPI003AD69F59
MEHSISQYVRKSIDIDPDWQRPTPSQRSLRYDIWLCLATSLLAFVSSISYQSLGLFGDNHQEILWSYILAQLMVLPLTVRRRYPLTAFAVATLIFFVPPSLTVSPPIYFTLIFQGTYLFLLYTVIAWGQDRKLVWMSVYIVIFLTIVWITIAWTLQGVALFNVNEMAQNGPIDTSLATLLTLCINNGLYFGSGIALGRISWIRAYQSEILENQRHELEQQSEQLAQDRVVRERLRVARELHDSVGHHISVISLQSGAARCLLHKYPDKATEALQNVEQSASTAITEMRSIVRLLRHDGEHSQAEGNLTYNEPTLEQLQQLFIEVEASGIHVEYLTSEHQEKSLTKIPQGTQSSIYRMIQESLNNVRRHSLARTVHVIVRSVEVNYRVWIEIEIIDDGCLKKEHTDIPSSRYGLRGIKERAEALGGSATYGHRTNAQGWFVYIRIPERHSENT